jgi:hypothetical protein
VAQNTLKVGIAVGLIAGAATAGALLVMGRHAGGAAVPFAATVNPIAPLAAAIGSIPPSWVVIGAISWLATAAAWGAVFAWLVVEWSGRTIVPAIVVSVSQFLIATAVARASGRGVATVLTVGQRIGLALLFAAALVVGIRFAFSPHRARASLSNHSM